MKAPRTLIAGAVIAFCLAAASLAGAYEFAAGKSDHSIDGYLEGLAVGAVHEGTPTEHPTGIVSLQGKSSFGDMAALKFTLRGVQDGTVLHPDERWRFQDYRSIYQNRNPYFRFDEAYVDLYAEKGDLRIGIQKFSWGRLDEINPTDVLNFQDLTNPFVFDSNERKIGVPAIKGKLYSNVADLELAWIPRYVPYRLPMPDERWVPLVLKVPESVQLPMAPGAIPVASTVVPLTGVYEDVDMPAYTLADSEVGVKLSRAFGRSEVSVSYFHGIDPMPVFALPTDLAVTVLSNSPPLAALSAAVTLKPELLTMDMFGADFSTTTGNFTFRGEGAFYKDKHYQREAQSVLAGMFGPGPQQEAFLATLQALLASAPPGTSTVTHLEPSAIEEKNSAKYGLGLDYVIGDITLSGQVIQEYIFNYSDDNPVLFNKHGTDTMVTLGYRHQLLKNTLEIDLDGTWGIEYRQYLLNPSVAYSVTDNFKVTLAALVLGGESDSLFGQYDDNDEVYVKARYSF